MRGLLRKRTVFRPSVGAACLEERLVLSSSSSSLTHIRAVFNSEFKATVAELRTQISADVAQFRAIPSPSAQDASSFKTTVAHAIDTTEAKLSGLYSLLPNSGIKLLPKFQNALSGPGAKSLVHRLDASIDSFVKSPKHVSLNASFTRAISSVFDTESARLSKFFGTTAAAQASATGQATPLQQFIDSQIASELASSAAAAQQFAATAATVTSIPTNLVTASLSDLAPFFNQVAQSMGVTPFQLAVDLSLFPLGTSTLTPQAQSALLGSGLGVPLATTVVGNSAVLSGLMTNPNFTGLINSILATPQSSDLLGNDSNLGLLSSGQNVSSLIDLLLGNATLPSTNAPLVANSLATAAAFPDILNGANTTFGTTGLDFTDVSSGLNTSFGSALASTAFMTTPNFGALVPSTTFSVATNAGFGLTGFDLGSSGFNPIF